MYISQKWLTNLLRAMDTGQSSFDTTAQELDSAFVRVGFETEGFRELPEITGPLVVGRVDHIEELTGFKKPIRFCQVNVGEANGTGEPQGIICGARNFAEGDLVVVALPGAVLPGGFEISARKTYDHISAGMLCSAAELGFTEKQTSGIITLAPGEAEPGDEARPIIANDDTVFDVNVTPDRGYALSARGLAREVASAYSLQFRDPALDAKVAGLDLSVVPEPEAALLDVNIQTDATVQRFGLRRVSGIDPAAESPFWLQRELMLCGARPVNAATDVTNYVMFLLGQPMHAFDADAISGGLHVRQAQEGEIFETLDHVKRTLSSEDVVICDDSSIQSLAGVMGGTRSEVSDSTTNVIFEAAIWDPRTVARTSRRHKLSSESSRRFERGVDPALVESALDYACALLVSIAGGSADSARTLVGETNLPEPIVLHPQRPRQLIGVDYDYATVVKRLEEIGARVVDTGSELAVTPPTWRPDLGMDVDLIEEIVRLEGIDNVPLALASPQGGRGLTPAQRRDRAVGHSLAYHGYVEILPTPFVNPQVFDAWDLDADDDRRNAVSVQNPLDADYSVIGTTLLPSMLEAVSRNVARGRRDLSVFGIQQVAFQGAATTPMPDVTARPDAAELSALLQSLPRQDKHVATVGVGSEDRPGPWGEGRTYSYADSIESARIVARAAGVDLEVRQAEHKPWHPGRCAGLFIENQLVGYAGELHPEVLEKLGLPERTCAMELNLSAVEVTEPMPAPILSAYPALHQDLALVVDESTPVEQVRSVVANAAGDLLEEVQVFDVFRGAQLVEGKKSVALQLIFRAHDRTLTDEEASERRLAAAEKARVELGAEMRA
ncbi:phenylalanine--tRNA ligase subunit beta [Corynebacterium tapiri]|uniref:Phenylalanine--tRNA ligase beta subunit n=1 Tax=Corynebacterium tapiri TaxID=1448266 RepID=A0A5C4U614_9CORY|nr:phenylalanine--tRNA ligase subunit beta [Corynebacterium tapiri]TNL99849.1 phenylalanine--tRNA ligase subunit beta [Corynebacterium tapiri]